MARYLVTLTRSTHERREMIIEADDLKTATKRAKRFANASPQREFTYQSDGTAISPGASYYPASMPPKPNENLGEWDIADPEETLRAVARELEKTK